MELLLLRNVLLFKCSVQERFVPKLLQMWITLSTGEISLQWLMYKNVIGFPDTCQLDCDLSFG